MNGRTLYVSNKYHPALILQGWRWDFFFFFSIFQRPANCNPDDGGGGEIGVFMMGLGCDFVCKGPKDTKRHKKAQRLYQDCLVSIHLVI